LAVGGDPAHEDADAADAEQFADGRLDILPGEIAEAGLVDEVEGGVGKGQMAHVAKDVALAAFGRRPRMDIGAILDAPSLDPDVFEAQ
jgi:hypothetical protein